MNYVTPMKGNPTIFITNDDVKKNNVMLATELREIVEDLEHTSITVDVTDVSILPLIVAGSLLSLAMSLKDQGKELDLRATDDVAGPIQILGATPFFRTVEVKQS